MDGPTLLADLKRITTSLADNYLQLGMLQSQERESKLRAFFNSTSRSVSEREKEAEFACMMISTEIIKVRGEVNALVEEKSYVQECLRWLNSQPKTPFTTGVIAQQRQPSNGVSPNTPVGASHFDAFTPFPPIVPFPT